MMELSPKQQTVNEIKKASRILVLGHKKPDGDHLGSLLALEGALKKLDKKCEVVVSDKIDEIFKFLPGANKVKTDFQHTDGKMLKIDTKKIPISGMKWQRDGDFLNIYLETDKNLKFEFIKIENGLPKPDLVIIVDTPDVEKIDAVYDKNTELFFEIPIINIDHHPGNEYYGTVNLVDLTATSTAEILVSLFEALGLKIDGTELATNLLAGIIYDTQSFRNQTTTPKSLTVAAQLLAAGGKQQEIISNFYKQKPVELLKVWGEMLSNIEEDKTHRFAWTTIDTINNNSISKEDIFGATDDLLSNTPDADMSLILFRGSDDKETVYGKLKGSKNKEVLTIAKLFGGGGTTFDALFEYKESNLEKAKNKILKKIADSWQDDGTIEKQEVWEVIDKNEKDSSTKTVANEALGKQNGAESRIKIDKRKRLEKEDAIEEALRSISQVEKERNQKEFINIREIIDKKKIDLSGNNGDLDVFDESE